MTKVFSVSKLFGKNSLFIVRFNLVFVLLFLNIWDYMLTRDLFNAMALGLVMYVPVTVLWMIRLFKTDMLATLYSIVLSSILAVFFAEGYQMGADWFLKISFWLPYLIAAIVNAFWGLRIYAKYRRKLKMA